MALVLVKDRGEPIHTVRFVPTGFRITYLYLTKYCHIVSRGSIACRYANPYPTDEFLVIKLTRTRAAVPCTGGRVWVNGAGPYRVAPARRFSAESSYETVRPAGCADEARLRRVRLRSMRRAAVLLLLLACTAFAAGAAARPAAAPAACVAPEVRVHNEAVFGHFATLAAAKALRSRAAKVGFRGIKIENEGCGDFEVEIDGADRQADRTSFAQEAARAGFKVTFEQTAPPMQYKAGEVIGVFGRKRSVGEANSLMGRLSHSGFLFIDLVPEGKVWLVVMPQVPVKHALAIAHEAAAAGFHVQFRAGTK